MSDQRKRTRQLAPQAQSPRTASPRYIDRDEVARRLTYDICIPLIREAMVAFSAGETKQLLRSIIPLADSHLFGIMPGALGATKPFGAKLISIFPENAAQENATRRRQSHQGLIILFEPEAGTPVCVVHAGEVTAIRTAAASAVATNALARSDAKHLAILGTGEQAATHARAISRIRPLTSIAVWGRSSERASAFVDNMQTELALPVTAFITAQQAVADADIICTVTSASEPILKSEWVRPGTHINAVGSGQPGPAEIDNALVARARFFADSREGVLHQGAEFLHAKQAGLIDDSHILAEIGEVLAGTAEGRRTREEVTIYKSLGHIVQDLATAWWLYSQP